MSIGRACRSRWPTPPSQRVMRWPWLLRLKRTIRSMRPSNWPIGRWPKMPIRRSPRTKWPGESSGPPRASRWTIRIWKGSGIGTCISSAASASRACRRSACSWAVLRTPCPGTEWPPPITTSSSVSGRLMSATMPSWPNRTTALWSTTCRAESGLPKRPTVSTAPSIRSITSTTRLTTRPTASRRTGT